MDRVALRKFIDLESARLGFMNLGVTTPEPPGHYAVYERWLKNGLHAEMAYLATDRARQRRRDPSQILQGCLSILMLAVPYSPAPEIDEPPPGEGLYGRVASYAWGDDYHNVLPEKLDALVASIESFLGRAISNHWYTDTGPILERDLAQRAGLGWIGKNTCLIDPKRGSYFLLAEVFLDLDLEPDPPFSADRCGTCTRCLDSCPTGCILPDRTIDSGRCISYLTIELKGGIPRDMRHQMGDWVFGLQDNDGCWRGRYYLSMWLSNKNDSW